MAAVISTIPLPSAAPTAPKNALLKGKGKSFRVRLAQHRARSFRSRSRRMPVLRVYARTRSAARPSFKNRSASRSGTSFYDLLGVPEQGSRKDIKKAYREKARAYHPDSNPPEKKDECTQKFLQIQDAYQVLGDPELKANYDSSLRNANSALSWRSSISFRKGRSRSRGGVAGCVSEEDLQNAPAWRSKWKSQLHDLPTGWKPGSWASTIFRKRPDGTSRP